MAGYTRQDTANNIANGNVIDADDFDAEYNAVEAAFNASTGHKHDGTAGEGAPIEKVGPSQDLVVSATDVLPKTTNTLDLGSTGVQFKNGYFDGTLNTDVLTVDESATVGTTLGVTGAATLSSTLDVTGNTTVGGTLGVTGATGVDGDFDINTDKFTVASTSGNTAIAGTLAVTGASTLTGNVTASGTLDTGAVTIQSATTPLRIYDTADPANLVFSVAPTGNTTVAGTLAVTDGSTFTGAITASGGVTGALSGNATTASTWETARSITLTGDVTGTVSGVNGGDNISIATTVAENSVALGTDTTGNYMVGVSGGTGVTVTHTASEGSTATVAIGQDVSTTSDVTFNNLTVGGNLTVSGSTTTVNSETINLADSILTLNSNLTSGDEPPSTADGGININRGSLADRSLLWDESEDYWTVGTETFVAGTFTGNLKGDVENTAGTTILDSGTGTTSATFTGNVTGDVTGNVKGDVKNAAGTVILDAGDANTAAALTGNVTGTVSSISNHTTDDLSEAATDPTNLWFTDARAQAAITVTDAGGDGSLAYSSGTITYTGPSATETRAHFSGGTGIAITDGSIAIDSTDTGISLAKLVVDDITIDGSTLTDAGTFTVDAGGDIVLDADGNDFLFKNGAGGDTATLTLANDASLQLSNSQAISLKPTTVGADVKVLAPSTADGLVVKRDAGSETIKLYAGNSSTSVNAGVSTNHGLDILASEIYLDSGAGNTYVDANTLFNVQVGSTTEMKVTTSGVNVANGLHAGNTTTTPVDNCVTADGYIAAGTDLYAGNDIIMSAGSSNWKFEIGGGNELTIYYGTTRLFKLDTSGNLTVSGNVTAYGTP